jgi:hypothetical protein
VKIQEKEWFAERSPEITNAPNAAARKRMIEALKTAAPELHRRFLADYRQAEGESHLLRDSGLYPLCGRGDINLYAVFAEAARNLLNERGRCGCVLPTGIATDDTTKLFFQDVMEKKSLVSLFDFENKGLFPDVDSRMKFCLFTAGRGLRPSAQSAEFVFFAHTVEALRDPERRFTLSAEDIALLNPIHEHARFFVHDEMPSLPRRFTAVYRCSYARREVLDQKRIRGVFVHDHVPYGQRLPPFPHARAARSGGMATRGEHLPQGW